VTLWLSFPANPDIDVELCEGRLNTEEFRDCMGDVDAVVDASIEIIDSRFPDILDGPPGGEENSPATFAVIPFSTAAPAAGVDIIAEAVDPSIVVLPVGISLNWLLEEGMRYFVPLGAL